jgi:hypothetical protein
MDLPKLNKLTNLNKDSLILDIQDLLYQFESDKITYSTFVNTLKTIADYEKLQLVKNSKKILNGEI